MIFEIFLFVKYYLLFNCTINLKGKFLVGRTVLYNKFLTINTNL
jgi:hypothetical protein